MKLKQFYGHSSAEAVFINGFMQLVKVKGVWHGLNHRSCDPTSFSKRSVRARWAEVVGVSPRDLENWMRREAAARRKEHLQIQLARAIRTLEMHGYEVDK